MVNFYSKKDFVFIFPMFFRRSYKNAQGLNGMAPKEKYFWPIESWVFTFFFNPCFCPQFFMMSTLMWPLGYEHERFDFFKKIRCWNLQ
jgi:hypothetical protein